MNHHNMHAHALARRSRVLLVTAVLSLMSASVYAAPSAVGSYNDATEAARGLKQDLLKKRVQCAELTSGNLESGSKCWRAKKDQASAIADTVDMIRAKYATAYADALERDKPRVLHEQIDFEVQLNRYCDATLTFEALMNLASYAPDSDALARDAIMHFEILSLCAREASSPDTVIPVMNQKYPEAKAHYYDAGMSGPGYVMPKRRMVVAWRRVVEAFAWGSDDAYANPKIAKSIWEKWDDLKGTWEQLTRMASLFLCSDAVTPSDFDGLRKQYAILIGPLGQCN